MSPNDPSAAANTLLAQQTRTRRPPAPDPTARVHALAASPPGGTQPAALPLSAPGAGERAAPVPGSSARRDSSSGAARAGGLAASGL